jgi:signal transduction histidine kinase
LQERLATLGQLSAVIAHELRNPLMVIKASVRELQRQGASLDDVRDRPWTSSARSRGSTGS